MRKKSGIKPLKTTKIMFPENKLSVAYGLNFYKLFWVFFIGCFAGVVVETLWCMATWHKIESRTGLILGPFNPVYGFGAVIMTVCLYRFRRKRDLWIFLAGIVLGGAFEYLCSWVQEVLFGTVSWQYNRLQFSIGGRTSLLYSFFWGILSLLWVKNIYPFMSCLIEKISNRLMKSLTWILLLYMIFNMMFSSVAVYRQTQRHNGVPAATAVDQFMDTYFNDSVLKIVYPNMKAVK